MSQFIEIPATKKSLVQRKPIYGIGINDADYNTCLKVDGKFYRCPFYKTWVSILTRCYDDKYKQKQPTYKDCTVTKEWLFFSNFKKWMVTQNWTEKELDKDIINPGNKVYGPDNCVFVDKSLNALLNTHSSRKGKYPQGVCFHKATNKFSAQCNIDSKRKHLGLFNNPQEASKVYNKFKSYLVTKIANEQTDQRIKNGLLKHAKIILKG